MQVFDPRIRLISDAVDEYTYLIFKEHAMVVYGTPKMIHIGTASLVAYNSSARFAAVTTHDSQTTLQRHVDIDEGAI